MYNCDDLNSTLRLNLIWNDKADNESGYRIFRDGIQVADLPSNSAMYIEMINMPASRRVQYYVQAYNGIGAADGAFVNLICN